MKIVERRLVIQDWYETEYTKTGWDNHEWQFKDDRNVINPQEWVIISHLDSDKFGNPILAIAEKETEI